MATETGTITILEQEIKVEYDYHWDNDGIGAYEYWGAKCYDHGMDYVKVEDIRPIFGCESMADQNAILQELNNNYEKYADELSQRHESMSL